MYLSVVFRFNFACEVAKSWLKSIIIIIMWDTSEYPSDVGTIKLFKVMKISGF